MLTGEEIDAQRRDLPGAGVQGPRRRPRAAGGAPQQRVARHGDERRCSRSCARRPSAQLLERDDFAKRCGARRADLDARAALPAAAGLRLGRGARRRRARRHRPEVQPAARARHPARLRPARAGGPDDADPGRAPTAREDVQVAGQPDRRDRPAGRDVRQDDVDPRRARWREYYRLLLGRELPSRRRAPPRDAKRALARELVALATTARRPPTRAERDSTASFVEQRAARARSRRPTCSRATAGTVHLPGADRRAVRRLALGGAAADRPGRRLARRRAARRRTSTTSPPSGSTGRVLRVGKRRFRAPARAQPAEPDGADDALRLRRAILADRPAARRPGRCLRRPRVLRREESPSEPRRRGGL